MRPRSTKRIRHFAQAYRLHAEFLQKIASIIGLPSARGQTHAYLLDRMNREVWDNPQYARLPQHWRDHLRGFAEACWQSHWAVLEWMIEWRGIILNKNESEQMIPAGDWGNVRTGEGSLSGHYWRTFTGTPKGWNGRLVRY